MTKKKILVVDDEIDLVEIMRLRFEEAGYEMISAHDGNEALEKARREKPDLIILDLMLPKMDGHKVCGLLKKDLRYTKIPIIILTAKVHEEDIRLSEEVGADAHFTKPVEYPVFLDKIKGLLNR